MSKVVRAVVGIGLIVAGVFMGGTTWPLAVMALGGGIAASALQPKINMPSVSEATSGRLNKSLEPECFRKVPFGITALGTDTRYWEAYGADQSNYDEVIALAGCEITSFDALYVEDELVTFDGSGNATGTYAGALSIKTELVGTSGSTLSGVGAGSKWVTADSESASMTGIAYMVLKWVWSQEKLPRGFPTRITPVGKGALVYDVRLDSTRGGTGSHRADDQSTWAFTTTDSNGQPIGRNPALQILHYLLGWYVQNPDTSEWVLVHGMGIDPDDIDFASFITAANECEAEEYYADCLLSTGDNHATNLGVLEQACMGKVSDAGGQYTLRIQVDDFTGTLTEFTDDDVVGECDWRPEMPLAQSGYNQVAGQFIDPDALYQLRPLPLIRDAAYETADGEKVRTNVRLDAVQDGDQAQKLLRIRLNKSRQKGMFEAPFGWRAVNVAVGQPVKLTLSRFGFDERYFRVRAKKVDPGGAVWLALETDHPDVYTGGTVATVPAIATGAGYDPTSVATPTSGEWGGTGGSITVTDGAEVPVVTITAGETSYPTGITGILAYTSQTSNTGPWNFRGEYPPGTDAFNLEGLLANETYYVRLSYRNAFGVIDPSSSSLVLGPYTTGDAVTTDTLNVGGTPAVDVLADLAAAEEDILALIEDIQTNADDIAQEASDRADAVAAERLLTQREIGELSQSVGAQVAALLSLVDREGDRRLSDDARIEELVIGVGARLDGDEFYSASSVDATFLAIADFDSTMGAYDLTVHSDFAALSSDVDDIATEVDDLPNVYLSQADASTTYATQASQTASLAALQASVEAQIDVVAGDLDDLDDVVATVSAQSSSNQTALATLTRSVAEMSQSVGAALAGALAAIGTQTTALADVEQAAFNQITQYRAEFAAQLDDAVEGTLANSIAEIESYAVGQTDIDSSLAAWGLSVGSEYNITTRIGDAETDILDIIADVSALDSDLTTLTSAVAAIEADYLTSTDQTSAFAGFGLTIGAEYNITTRFGDVETDVDDLTDDLVDANAAIDVNAVAIAATDRAVAEMSQSIGAYLAGALAEGASGVEAAVTQSEAVLRRVETLRATLVGDYLTEAEVVATYLATADLESAVALIDLTANATFSTALDDIDAIEADLIANYLTSASAASTYLASADLETAFASIDVTANATIDDLVVDVGIFLDAYTDGAGNAIATLVLEAAAGGGNPAYISIQDGAGLNEAVVAATQIVLANLGAAANEILPVLTAQGGFAFFSQPIHIDDDPTPTARLIIGPDPDWLIWLGPPSEDADSATIANSDFALGTDGQAYFGGEAAGTLATRSTATQGFNDYSVTDRSVASTSSVVMLALDATNLEEGSEVDIDIGFGTNSIFGTATNITMNTPAAAFNVDIFLRVYRDKGGANELLLYETALSLDQTPSTNFTRTTIPYLAIPKLTDTVPSGGGDLEYSIYVECERSDTQASTGVNIGWANLHRNIRATERQV